MSKIFLTTTLGQDNKLLSKFLQHYQSLGIGDFLILLNSDSIPVVDYVRHTLALYKLSITEIWTEEFSEAQKHKYERFAIERTCDYDDWVVYANIDEFQEYPTALNDYLEFCNRRRVNYLEGRIADRVSADGKLVEYDQRHILDVQFPYKGNITRPLLKARDKKIVVARAYKNVGSRHHTFLLEDNSPARYWPFLSKLSKGITIHHFKWDSTVLARMNTLLSYKDESLKAWKKETSNFLDHFAKFGRINISDKRFRFKPISKILHV